MICFVPRLGLSHGVIAWKRPISINAPAGRRHFLGRVEHFLGHAEELILALWHEEDIAQKDGAAEAGTASEVHDVVK